MAKPLRRDPEGACRYPVFPIGINTYFARSPQTSSKGVRFGGDVGENRDIFSEQPTTQVKKDIEFIGNR